MDDPYRTLGVPRDASAEDIRAAYRRAIRAAHPDAGGSQEGAAALNAAYSVLSSTARRAEWDRRNPVGPPPVARPTPPPSYRPAPPSSTRPPAAPPRRAAPGPAVVFVGVVAVALVGLLFATFGAGTPRAEPGDDSPFVVSVGDCVDLDRGVPTDVPCDGGRADGEVVAFGPACPSGTEAVAADGGGLCVDRFPSFSPESCVAIQGQVVTPVECGPSPDGIVSAVVADPGECPLGVTGIATLGDGDYACIVIP